VISRFGQYKVKSSFNLLDKSGANSSLSQLDQPRSDQNEEVSIKRCSNQVEKKRLTEGQKSSGKLEDFNELVQELRIEMEEQEEDIVELFYRVYMFGDGNQDEKQVPLIFMARLTKLDTYNEMKHQLLTFTDVSLVFLRAQ